MLACQAGVCVSVCTSLPLSWPVWLKHWVRLAAQSLSLCLLSFERDMLWHVPCLQASYGNALLTYTRWVHTHPLPR